MDPVDQQSLEKKQLCQKQKLLSQNQLEQHQLQQQPQQTFYPQHQVLQVQSQSQQQQQLVKKQQLQRQNQQGILQQTILQQEHFKQQQMLLGGQKKQQQTLRELLELQDNNKDEDKPKEDRLLVQKQGPQLIQQQQQLHLKQQQRQQREQQQPLQKLQQKQQYQSQQQTQIVVQQTIQTKSQEVQQQPLLMQKSQPQIVKRTQLVQQSQPIQFSQLLQQPQQNHQYTKSTQQTQKHPPHTQQQLQQQLQQLLLNNKSLPQRIVVLGSQPQQQPQQNVSANTTNQQKLLPQQMQCVVVTSASQQQQQHQQQHIVVTGNGQTQQPMHRIVVTNTSQQQQQQQQGQIVVTSAGQQQSPIQPAVLSSTLQQQSTQIKNTTVTSSIQQSQQMQHVVASTIASQQQQLQRIVVTTTSSHPLQLKSSGRLNVGQINSLQETQQIKSQSQCNVIVSQLQSKDPQSTASKQQQKRVAISNQSQFLKSSQPQSLSHQVVLNKKLTQQSIQPVMQHGVVLHQQKAQEEEQQIQKQKQVNQNVAINHESQKQMSIKTLDKNLVQQLNIKQSHQQLQQLHNQPSQKQLQLKQLNIHVQPQDQLFQQNPIKQENNLQQNKRSSGLIIGRLQQSLQPEPEKLQHQFHLQHLQRQKLRECMLQKQRLQLQKPQENNSHEQQIQQKNQQHLREQVLLKQHLKQQTQHQIQQQLLLRQQESSENRIFYVINSKEEQMQENKVKTINQQNELPKPDLLKPSLKSNVTGQQFDVGNNLNIKEGVINTKQQLMILSSTSDEEGDDDTTSDHQLIEAKRLVCERYNALSVTLGPKYKVHYNEILKNWLHGRLSQAEFHCNIRKVLYVSWALSSNSKNQDKIRDNKSDFTNHISKMSSVTFLPSVNLTKKKSGAEMIEKTANTTLGVPTSTLKQEVASSCSKLKSHALFFSENAMEEKKEIDVVLRKNEAVVILEKRLSLHNAFITSLVKWIPLNSQWLEQRATRVQGVTEIGWPIRLYTYADIPQTRGPTDHWYPEEPGSLARWYWPDHLPCNSFTNTFDAIFTTNQPFLVEEKKNTVLSAVSQISPSRFFIPWLLGMVDDKNTLLSVERKLYLEMYELTMTKCLPFQLLRHKKRLALMIQSRNAHSKLLCALKSRNQDLSYKEHRLIKQIKCLKCRLSLRRRKVLALFKIREQVLKVRVHKCFNELWQEEPDHKGQQELFNDANLIINDSITDEDEEKDQENMFLKQHWSRVCQLKENNVKQQQGLKIKNANCLQKQTSQVRRQMSAALTIQLLRDRQQIQSCHRLLQTVQTERFKIILCANRIRELQHKYCPCGELSGQPCRYRVQMHRFLRKLKDPNKLSKISAQEQSTSMPDNSEKEKAITEDSKKPSMSTTKIKRLKTRKKKNKKTKIKTTFQSAKKKTAKIAKKKKSSKVGKIKLNDKSSKDIKKTKVIEKEEKSEDTNTSTLGKTVSPSLNDDKTIKTVEKHDIGVSCELLKDRSPPLPSLHSSVFQKSLRTIDSKSTISVAEAAARVVKSALAASRQTRRRKIALANKTRNSTTEDNFNQKASELMPPPPPPPPKILVSLKSTLARLDRHSLEQEHTNDSVNKINYSNNIGIKTENLYLQEPLQQQNKRLVEQSYNSNLEREELNRKLQYKEGQQKSNYCFYYSGGDYYSSDDDMSEPFFPPLVHDLRIDQIPRPLNLIPVAARFPPGIRKQLLSEPPFFSNQNDLEVLPKSEVYKTKTNPKRIELNPQEHLRKKQKKSRYEPVIMKNDPIKESLSSTSQSKFSTSRTPVDLNGINEPITSSVKKKSLTTKEKKIDEQLQPKLMQKPQRCMQEEKQKNYDLTVDKQVETVKQHKKNKKHIEKKQSVMAKITTPSPLVERRSLRVSIKLQEQKVDLKPELVVKQKQDSSRKTPTLIENKSTSKLKSKYTSIKPQDDCKKESKYLKIQEENDLPPLKKKVVEVGLTENNKKSKDHSTEFNCIQLRKENKKNKQDNFKIPKVADVKQLSLSRDQCHHSNQLLPDCCKQLQSTFTNKKHETTEIQKSIKKFRKLVNALPPEKQLQQLFKLKQILQPSVLSGIQNKSIQCFLSVGVQNKIDELLANMQNLSSGEQKRKASLILSSVDNKTEKKLTKQIHSLLLHIKQQWEDMHKFTMIKTIVKNEKTNTLSKNESNPNYEKNNELLCLEQKSQTKKKQNTNNLQQKQLEQHKRIERIKFLEEKRFILEQQKIELDQQKLQKKEHQKQMNKLLKIHGVSRNTIEQQQSKCLWVLAKLPVLSNERILPLHEQLMRKIVKEKNTRQLLEDGNQVKPKVTKIEMASKKNSAPANPANDFDLEPRKINCRGSAYWWTKIGMQRKTSRLLLTAKKSLNKKSEFVTVPLGCQRQHTRPQIGKKAAIVIVKNYKKTTHTILTLDEKNKLKQMLEPDILKLITESEKKWLEHLQSNIVELELQVNKCYKAMTEKQKRQVRLLLKHGKKLKQKYRRKFILQLKFITTHPQKNVSKKWKQLEAMRVERQKQWKEKLSQVLKIKMTSKMYFRELYDRLMKLLTTSDQCQQQQNTLSALKQLQHKPLKPSERQHLLKLMQLPNQKIMNQSLPSPIQKIQALTQQKKSLQTKSLPKHSLKIVKQQLRMPQKYRKHRKNISKKSKKKVLSTKQALHKSDKQKKKKNKQPRKKQKQHVKRGILRNRQLQVQCAMKKQTSKDCNVPRMSLKPALEMNLRHLFQLRNRFINFQSQKNKISQHQQPLPITNNTGTISKSKTQVINNKWILRKITLLLYIQRIILQRQLDRLNSCYPEIVDKHHDSLVLLTPQKSTNLQQLAQKTTVNLISLRPLTSEQLAKNSKVLLQREQQQMAVEKRQVLKQRLSGVLSQLRPLLGLWELNLQFPKRWLRRQLDNIERTGQKELSIQGMPNASYQNVCRNKLLKRHNDNRQVKTMRIKLLRLWQQFQQIHEHLRWRQNQVHELLTELLTAMRNRQHMMLSTLKIPQNPIRHSIALKLGKWSKKKQLFSKYLALLKLQLPLTPKMQSLTYSVMLKLRRSQLMSKKISSNYSALLKLQKSSIRSALSTPQEPSPLKQQFSISIAQKKPFKLNQSSSNVSSVISSGSKQQSIISMSSTVGAKNKSPINRQTLCHIKQNNNQQFQNKRQLFDDKVYENGYENIISKSTKEPKLPSLLFNSKQMRCSGSGPHSKTKSLVTIDGKEQQTSTVIISDKYDEAEALRTSCDKSSSKAKLKSCLKTKKPVYRNIVANKRADKKNWSNTTGQKNCSEKNEVQKVNKILNLTVPSIPEELSVTVSKPKDIIVFMRKPIKVLTDCSKLLKVAVIESVQTTMITTCNKKLNKPFQLNKSLKMAVSIKNVTKSVEANCMNAVIKKLTKTAVTVAREKSMDSDKNHSTINVLNQMPFENIVANQILRRHRRLNRTVTVDTSGPPVPKFFDHGFLDDTFEKAIHGRFVTTLISMAALNSINSYVPSLRPRSPLECATIEQQDTVTKLSDIDSESSDALKTSDGKVSTSTNTPIKLCNIMDFLEKSDKTLVDSGCSTVHIWNGCARTSGPLLVHAFKAAKKQSDSLQVHIPSQFETKMLNGTTLLTSRQSRITAPKAEKIVSKPVITITRPLYQRSLSATAALTSTDNINCNRYAALKRSASVAFTETPAVLSVAKDQETKSTAMVVDVDKTERQTLKRSAATAFQSLPESVTKSNTFDVPSVSLTTSMSIPVAQKSKRSAALSTTSISSTFLKSSISEVKRSKISKSTSSPSIVSDVPKSLTTAEVLPNSAVKTTNRSKQVDLTPSNNSTFICSSTAEESTTTLPNITKLSPKSPKRSKPAVPSTTNFKSITSHPVVDVTKQSKKSKVVESIETIEINAPSMHATPMVSVTREPDNTSEVTKSEDFVATSDIFDQHIIADANMSTKNNNVKKTTTITEEEMHTITVTRTRCPIVPAPIDVTADACTLVVSACEKFVRAMVIERLTKAGHGFGTMELRRRDAFAAAMAFDENICPTPEYCLTSTLAVTTSAANCSISSCGKDWPEHKLLRFPVTTVDDMTDEQSERPKQSIVIECESNTTTVLTVETVVETQTTTTTTTTITLADDDNQQPTTTIYTVKTEPSSKTDVVMSNVSARTREDVVQKNIKTNSTKPKTVKTIINERPKNISTLQSEKQSSTDQHFPLNTTLHQPQADIKVTKEIPDSVTEVSVTKTSPAIVLDHFMSTIVKNPAFVADHKSRFFVELGRPLLRPTFHRRRPFSTLVDTSVMVALQTTSENKAAHTYINNNPEKMDDENHEVDYGCDSWGCYFGNSSCLPPVSRLSGFMINPKMPSKSPISTNDHMYFDEDEYNLLLARQRKRLIDEITRQRHERNQLEQEMKRRLQEQQKRPSLTQEEYYRRFLRLQYGSENATPKPPKLLYSSLNRDKRHGIVSW